MFVGTFIILTAGGIFGSMIFTQALILAIVYTYAQENRGKQIKFFVLDMDVKWLPYALLALNFIVAGPASAKIQFCGIPAAHLYDFLTQYWPEFGGGWNILQTPAFVSGWFGADGRTKWVVTKKNGIAFKPPTQPTASSSGSSFFSSSWGSRGQGRRLGGE
ncbi:MAG: hypothetical protein MMC33_006143 [Icmadophila ericetorum]|nr:hypothetical protein [Icmadophila ericetorum]